MRIVVALGGNALLRRGEPPSTESQRHNLHAATAALAQIAIEHSLVVTHGNGPQVGLLAMQAEAISNADPPPLETPRYSVFERSPAVLSDAEYAEVQDQVLEQCGLDEDIPLRQAPWYLHYEMGLELVEREDPQRALDAFIEASERRHTSKRKARIYGMWFKDYLPYYQIARAHSMLGNWECASDALDVSRSMGEVRAGDKQYDDFEKLRRQVRGQVEP